MKKILVFILVFIITFSGCTRITEVDSKSFVTAIGFDKGENYNLRFTFVFTSPSKENNSKGGSKNDETIVIEAPSLYSAIEQINNFKSQTIVLTHTQTLIFSEELAREGLAEFIYMLVRSNHFRPNTYVCITDKSSMEFLEKINPVQTYHLEKYFQLLFNKMTSGTKGDLYLYDSYFRLLSASESSVLPYCALNEVKITHSEPKEDESEKPSEEPSEGETVGGTFAPNTDDYAVNIIAGHTISKSENTSEIQGVAIIKGGKLVCVLGRNEAMALQMIINSLPPSYITISNAYVPNRMITCYIATGSRTKIKVNCDDSPYISITVNLEGDFVEVGEDDTYIENPKLFEEYFETKTKESLSKFLEKIKLLDCDICGFSEVAKMNFTKTDDWEAYKWAEKFSDAQFDINVNLTVRTYGELSQKDYRG